MSKDADFKGLHFFYRLISLTELNAATLKILYAFIFSWILFPLTIVPASAQKPVEGLRHKNGFIKKAGSLQDNGPVLQNLPPAVFNKKIYSVLQFNRLPDSALKVAMAQKGISLAGYLSGNAFMAELPDSIITSDLLPFRINGIYNLPPAFKIAGKLLKKLDNKTYRATPENPVALSYYGTMSYTEIKASLEQMGAGIVNTKIRIPKVIFILADAAAIRRIAGLPFVNYVMDLKLKDVPVNFNNRSKHAVEALGAASGRNLQGKNVTIGVGDDANPATHVDFTNRLIVRTPAPAYSHGTHTTGTTGGGGILNPVNKGMAPKSLLISKFFSDVLIDAPVYIADNNMVLTNNSYYSGEAGCVGDGEYNFLSTYLDYQLSILPSLLHVFASGNDGARVCTPFGSPFGTIKSGFQCAKNVLTVGNLNGFTNSINPGSSAGPVDDGRIKPEIVAGGTVVVSTWPNNAYGDFSGTSMAAPTVTGTLALLYERYRQLNGGSDPAGALIKAIACNSATDLGNAGPDYIYGFGALNARKAVETIENASFLSNTVNNGTSFSQSITIPSGAQQVKIMLYWSDPEAAPGAPVTLVNNLDLTVTTPSSVVHLPLVLNPTPGSVNNTATELTDNTNNIEQVVLNAPAAGNYTIKVDGTSVPVGPQRFYIVYEIIQPSVTVEFPFGNETLVPGEAVNIRWHASGGAGNTFTIEYSPDNGSNWSVIDGSVPDGSRSYPWTVPSTATNAALIRVTRNTAGYIDVSDYSFTILGQPVISSLTNPCEGYVNINWNLVTGATGYEVMMLDADSMKVIASTASNSYLVDGLDTDKTYWFAVRAVNGTTPGRRSLAASIQPSGGDCLLPAFDNDLSVDLMPGVASGRMFTLTQLGTMEDISIRLKNLGNIASSGSFNLHYQVNGGSIVSELVSPNLAAHSSLTYLFTTKADFSTPGTYTVKAWVEYPGDGYHSNDTVTTIVKQLENAPVALNPSFTEGFETAAAFSYITKTIGLDGLDRADFNADNANGRVSTFVNSGFARSGNRCVTLDQVVNTGSPSADSLITTFNLSSYTLADNILLSFFYKNHGINFPLPGNAVWIRGSETGAWINVFTLPISISDIGGYRASPAINITEALAAASQTFSSSFQVKFGQHGYKSANSPDAPGINVDNGISYDDINFIRTLDDVSVTVLQQPVLSGVCSLSASETITVLVKNSGSSNLTDVPVSYQVNGTVITENIASIPANSSVVYNFTTPSNLSAFQEYQLQVWTDYAGDTYKLNDTLTAGFRTSPLIAGFPYQEGFESSNGYWYTSGISTSWLWGSPSKPIISTAAGGTNAWVTGLTSNYNNGEYSFLYSPCFNLSGLSYPVLAFSHIYRMEDNCDPGICDTHWAEYSVDDINWIKLGANGSGSNWYDDSRNIWKASRPLWHESIIDMPLNPSKIRLRFVVSSDPALNYDGVGIDNIRLFDSSFTVLPLTLLSFKAVREDTNGQLTWSTSQETNTDQFIVQKSNNGNSYNDLGSVRAANNASVITTYRFTDYNLYAGTSFYRLKMIDKDGRFTYSPVRTINYETDGLFIQIFPNPVTKSVLYINASADCTGVELSDVSGRILKKVIVKGLNPTLSVDGLAKGMYFITVATTEGRKTQKILVE